ncbi:MAG: hypothetical protein COA96_16880 [SAR86 cluster bacterium]|uniref:Uncharacterized protein n=1 Tax=SAR86 cluster bacterium TaxID=2030880 RepID=A0A2A5AG87_9GAMM|nr:MAG: hypothetical protein COA96_16880 [SAR86 cluster bacterium]
MIPSGPQFAARVALYVATNITGIAPLPRNVRDTGRVRGLAALMLNDGGMTWLDIAIHLYGRRVHTTPHKGADQWRGTVQAEAAIAEFRKLWEVQT